MYNFCYVLQSQKQNPKKNSATSLRLYDQKPATRKYIKNIQQNGKINNLVGQTGKT